MFSKFCGRLFLRAGSVDVSKLSIKRMLPETTDVQVINELKAELKQIGWNNFRKLMLDEKEALTVLNSQQEEVVKKVEDQCLIPALQRVSQGYDTKGLFWHETQEKLHKIVKPDEVMELQQKIDWLRTRQSFKKRLDEEYYLIISQQMDMSL